MSNDRFLTLAEVAEILPGRRRTTAHLRKIAQSQAGVFKRPRFSQACLASYPRFVKGVGGEWGCFESEITALLDRLRVKAARR